MGSQHSRAGQRRLRADQAAADEPGLARDRSDDWVVDFSGDGLPEIAIGRLSVRTASLSARGGPSPTWGRHWLSCPMSGGYRTA